MILKSEYSISLFGSNSIVIVFFISMTVKNTGSGLLFPILSIETDAQNSLNSYSPRITFHRLLSVMRSSGGLSSFSSGLPLGRPKL